jgi:hypothetical protein
LSTIERYVISMSWSSAFPKGVEESVEAPGSEPESRLGTDRSFELFHNATITSGCLYQTIVNLRLSANVETTTAYF